MAKSNSGNSEGLQIAILTFFFTAAGLLLVTLFFSYYLNPRIDQASKRAAGDYEKLSQMLLDKEMKRLRDEARAAAEQENDAGAKEIIQSQLATYGLTFTDVQESRKAARRGPTRGKAPQSSTEEVKIDVRLEPASMRPIVQFIASVLDEKRTLQVGSVDLMQNRREPNADSWTAKIEFIDYVQTEGS